MDILQPITVTAATITLTKDHANAVINLSRAAGIAVTLPAALGTGRPYKLFTLTTVTSNNNIVQVANSTDVMQGVAWFLTTASDNVIGFKTSATSDTISMNGTTQGGVVGDIIEITDVKAGFFSVKMFASPTGSYATPFSAAVP